MSASCSQGVYNGLSQIVSMSQNANGLFPGSQLSQEVNGSQSFQNRLSLSSQSSGVLTQIPNSPLGKSEESRPDNNSGATATEADTQKATLENVTPVNSKCLSKAFKPPVTIKTFFKPSSTTAQNQAVTESSNEQVSNSNPVNHESKVPSKERHKSKEISYEDFLKREDSSDSNENNGEPMDQIEQGQASKKVMTSKVPIVELEDSNSSGTSKSDTCESRSYFKSSSTKKRTLDERTSSQPSKKPKQATLFSTFKKMATKKEEEELKSVTCPICNKVFEKMISNADLNSHIDNCIIE